MREDGYITVAEAKAIAQKKGKVRLYWFWKDEFNPEIQKGNFHPDELLDGGWHEKVFISTNYLLVFGRWLRWRHELKDAIV